MKMTKTTPNGLVELSDSEEAEILSFRAAVAKNRAESLAINGHKYSRALAYPSIADQLDMLWHAMDDGHLAKFNEFYDAIKAIKDKYPKGASHV